MACRRRRPQGVSAAKRPGVEKTVYLHALVKGFKTTFAFKSTAYNSGKSFSSATDKIRVEIDNESCASSGRSGR